MTCYHPLDALKPNNGGKLKFGLPEDLRKFERAQYSPIRIKCRQCIGCRIDHAAQWSLRLQHELQTQGLGYFVTLTYDEDHIPDDHSLDHKHVQLFTKYLRREFKGKKITYFVCGEYGDKTSRPHYHLVLFGITLDDIKHYKYVNGDKSRYQLFTSEKVESCWKRGGVIIGYANEQTINYTTRYMLKQLEGPKVVADRQGQKVQKAKYLDQFKIVDPSTGEIYERKRPYISVSTRPAIGRRWLDRYQSDLEKGYLMSNGTQRQIPDYYLRKLEEINPELAEKLRDKRLEIVEDPKYQEEHCREVLAIKKEMFLDKQKFFGIKRKKQ